MPDLGGLNVSGWPIWLLTVLMIINIFKQPLTNFLPNAIRDHFKHKAGQSDARLESDLRRVEREQQRTSWREEQIIELLQRWDAWIQDVSTSELRALREAVQTSNKLLAAQVGEIGLANKRLEQSLNADEKSAETLSRILGETKRTGNILQTVHISLSQLVDELRRSYARER